MFVPLLNLKAQYLTIKAEIDAAIDEVMDSQHFILGPEVEQCEEAIATYCGCSHAIGVSSGSDALLACLMAENIGPGDEVITTAYTFFATAGAIARVGATPVFVDIDPATYNLNVSQISSKITPRTRAIIPVHLYGQMAEMDIVTAIANKYNVVIIEDAAQAIGAEYKGRRAGSIGHYGCLSFFPSKNLGAAGDGGMVLTNDASRAEQLRCLRVHGSKAKYQYNIIGGNFRLDAIQAAIISAKLPHLDEWTAARQRNAQRYDQLFIGCGLATANSYVDTICRTPEVGDRTMRESAEVILPSVATDRHVFNQYVIRVPRRDQLKSALHDKGIETAIYYPLPLHLQECFSSLSYKVGILPNSESAAKETLALPVQPELTEQQARYVVSCIGQFFGSETILAVNTDRHTAFPSAGLQH